MAGTPEYRTWKSIKARCSNPNNHAYGYYGGRGIRVCGRWCESPTIFVQEVGKRPSPTHSIDRKDNNGHYSCGKCDECLANGWPMNVRWATRKEQAQNKRNNIWLTLNGERHVLKDWARIKGFTPETLRKRNRAGWSDEKTLTTPADRQRGIDGRFLNQ